MFMASASLLCAPRRALSCSCQSNLGVCVCAAGALSVRASGWQSCSTRSTWSYTVRHLDNKKVGRARSLSVSPVSPDGMRGVARLACCAMPVSCVRRLRTSFHPFRTAPRKASSTSRVTFHAWRLRNSRCVPFQRRQATTEPAVSSEVGLLCVCQPTFVVACPERTTTRRSRRTRSHC